MKNLILKLNVCKKIFQSAKLSINRKISLKSFNMGKSIPDRWLEYSKIGDIVDGTSFIPFKVPLHERICENLPETERHTTRDIIEALPNVGLVINLTNTQTRSKYYEPNDWVSSNIDYKWIKVEGHVTPSQQLLVQFCHTVKQFMLTNPSKLIGIHCTHGLNRTGYFVCSYMVLVQSIPPSEAIRRFAEARGYKIERENYISSIMLHDSNINLKQTVNTLPVLIPKSRMDLKSSNQTEIDKRYGDHKRRHFNDGEFSKSNTRRSRWNAYGSSKSYFNSNSYSTSSDRNDYGSRLSASDHNKERKPYAHYGGRKYDRSRYDGFDREAPPTGYLWSSNYASRREYNAYDSETSFRSNYLSRSEYQEPDLSRRSSSIRELKEPKHETSWRIKDNRSKKRHTEVDRPSRSDERSLKDKSSPKRRRSRSNIK